MLDGGVFVLPSRFEPWGVIVHEMAAAGFPLLLSDEVGAAEAFLTINENGFNFEANNIQSCQGALEKMASKSNLELKEMGHKSYASSNSISTETWFNKVKKFLN